MWQLYQRLAQDAMDERQREADARRRWGRPAGNRGRRPGSAPMLRLRRAAARMTER